MKITILTLFPEFFDSFQATSIIKRALDRQLVEFETVDFRQYTLDKHNHVDDTPCGGGQGMLLSCQPIVDCIKAVKTEGSLVVMMSPQGKTFTQKVAHEFANVNHLILLCGHYEGFDERIRDYVDMEISLGDFVLTGGEGAAMVISDAVIRLLNGVILEESHADDSFENGLLEYPQYTRPVEYDGKRVPDVLLSGHHANIRKWRLKQSLIRTMEKRPDLLENRVFTKEEEKLMQEIKAERALEKEK
ncbi:MULTISPECIES: tRNA (guanosine(37)-N1)-methyltransferase TrmD [Bacillota]|uniref:tRNA (guanine-N(1)-)-methyltransferase n=2 Tax=Amedibacillus TaxID=2749846 RepID=A0A7G9GLM5_9FIRM|nr:MULTISPECIES: tRNA (guanosine(37)-N1)-methyltransferase TrmD [Bacillota]QNM11707.1 tRNA (guanosine(37)-N1)-methyltransferase TrmD [[Eubacterium] hominis]MCH4285044.1 tRNA (guanosine(37)-N1)-methyltransferase TrmD [Amedibacillus hominis]RGB56076.1 tRNA (guanosine(37)-N1)-methyltransferase TrmD [Absiella sp. AM22-9]RGB61837.1 tRNA (guanosine(37)-N1)-methyltransferase TrmD [Absiella sp. AM10-20]RGB70342.1 tRNA (guanosine(37)-N1)-methyltransferase TrmD [Absiella sp. AM09-45]